MTVAGDHAMADDEHGARGADGSEDEAGEERVPVKAPWHFKVLVVGTAVYLAYRIYQGVGWLVHHL